MRVSRPVSLLAVGILLLITSAGVAGADTRLFSVETDRAGVTITGVEREGQALPQEGESGARTFFRIDGGSGDVPCRNQLLFTASNGQKREFIVDLCAHNWQVKLPLAEAADTSQSQPSSQTEAPSSGISRLTVHIDAPDISITEIYFDRARLELDRAANGVSAALTQQQGSTCEHDLGLALSDGRRIARVVDICAHDGAVGVAVNSDSAVPPPPVTAPPPAAAVPSEPARVDDLVWSSGSEGGRATLAYARPDSDQIEFFASCNPGTADIEISLERSESGLEPGGSVPVTFTIGGFERTYNGRGSDVSALSGVSHPEIRLDVADPFWPALLRGNDLTVRIGSAAAYTLSLKGSSAAGRPFLATCDRQVAPEAATPSASASASDYSCGEEGRLRSQRTDIESRLIFHNQSGVPVRLFWLDYDGRRRPYMTLGPGETGVQPSFYSHPWLVTDLRGRCLGIYSAQRSDKEITLAP